MIRTADILQGDAHLMGLGTAIFRALVVAARDVGETLDQTDRAVRVGKALDVLRQLLVGRHGIGEISVDASVSERDEGETRISLLASRPLSSDEMYAIRSVLRAVNQRFGTSVRVAVLQTLALD